MIKKYLYQSCFAELVIKPLVSTEKDRLLSLASLTEIKEFLPNIDTSLNLDILPVAFNACVVNRINKNKDIIDTATAVGMYRQFIHKPINLEHERSRVIGTILAAGFSEFGTDRPLTEEQVKGMSSPFNITLGGIIWRIVCPELSDHLEESSDPTSDKYLSVSASWELGFTDYKVVLLPGGAKNLSEASKIISDSKEVDEIKDKLTSLGGDGKVEDLFAYRMPAYNVLPLGIGFTEKPAAEVKGILTAEKPEVGVVIPPTFDDGKVEEVKMEEVEVKEDKPPVANEKESLAEEQPQNIISQNDNLNVKPKGIKYMKITSIKDITDESLKECTASSISDFISTELKKGSDEWETQKNALNTQIAKAQEDSKKLQDEQSKLQEQLKQMLATVETLNAEKLEREKVEKFNARMSEINEAFELDDEVRAALVEDVKAIASDEDFEKFKAKAKVLLKGFAKKTPPFGKDKKVDEKECEKEEKCKKEEKASKCKADMETVVASAVENGEVSKGGLPNTASADTPTLMEKYKSAFTKENFIITV